MSVAVVLSANIQNLEGDRHAEHVRFASHHEQSIAKWLQDTARKFNADLICTQEDPTGLLMDSYPEGAFACNHTMETVRIYVRRSHLADCTFQEHTDPAPKLPHECHSVPARCALTVQLPSGVRVTNVFLHGGRFVDRNFAYDECSHHMKALRQSFVQRIVHEAKPDILAGDWNSDPDEAKEQALYRDSKYTSSLGLSPEQLGAWLQWRASAYKPLRASGYTLSNMRASCPQGTASRSGGLMVDFFAYRKAYAKESKLECFPSFEALSDHAAILGRFTVNPPRRKPLPTKPREGDVWKVMERVRQPSLSPERSAREHKRKPVGLLFRISATPDPQDEAKGSQPSDCTSLQALLHIVKTRPGYMNDPDLRRKIRTSFVSFSKNLSTVLSLSSEAFGKRPWLWIMCPRRESYIDLSTQGKVEKLRGGSGAPDMEWAAPGEEGHPWSEQDIMGLNNYYGPKSLQVLVCRHALTTDPLVVVRVQDLLGDHNVERAINEVRSQPAGSRGALYNENWLIELALKSIQGHQEHTLSSSASCNRFQG